MNSKRLARLIRAILGGDFEFEARGRRRSREVALFLAGMELGVFMGVLLAPASRGRRGQVDEQTSRTDEFPTPSKEPLGETAAQSKAERSAS